MKVLLRLLILLLVPVLVVTVPTTAQAATVRGPASPLAVSLADPSASGPGHNFDCNLTGQWELDEGGASGVLNVKGDCETGWYVEYSVMEIRSIMFSGAGGCTLTSGGVDDAETPWTLSLPTADPCEITTATFNLCEDSYGASESGDCHYVQAGWSILLPEMDAPPAECPAFTLTGVEYKFEPVTGEYSDRQFRQTYSLSVIWNPAQTTLVQRNHLRLVPVVRYQNGPLQVRTPDGKAVVIPQGADGSGAFSWTGLVWEPTYGEMSDYDVVGIQVWYAGKTGMGSHGSSVVGSDVGLTFYEHCWFYVGDQIVNDPNTQADDPAMPLDGGPVSADPAPDPTPPAASAGCNFSISDPSTWLEGGICAVVGLLAAMWDTLKSILGALGNLVSGIVSGILDGLADLFIPSDGYLDSQVTSLKQDFKETAPGGYVDAVTGQSFDVSASGCGGIPVNWSMSGESFSFDFLAACSGFMANAAAIVKLAASALLVIFGGFGCVRAVGAGFGWAPSIGRGAAA